MYNRYIRNDHGTYTRIPEEDGPPVPPSGGMPLHGGDVPPEDGLTREGGQTRENGPPRQGETPLGGSPHNRPQAGERQERPPHGPGPRTAEPGHAPPHSAPPHSTPPHSAPGQNAPRSGPSHHARPGGILRRLLDDARMDRIDDGDLMLLVLLFFLAREGADEELLTALGLLLIL